MDWESLDQHEGSAAVWAGLATEIKEEDSNIQLFVFVLPIMKLY